MRRLSVALVGVALILFSAAAFADNTAGKNSETTWFFPNTEAVSPIQITLTWDTDLTDLDLHVFGPAGGHAFFGAPSGVPGGQLLVDDVDGFGPEVFNGPTAQSGTYTVNVDAFNITAGNPTNATLTIVSCNQIVFSGNYQFTASDGNAGNGVGVDSASFWNAHAFKATCGPTPAVTKTKVAPKGTTINTGTWTCKNPTSWSISADFDAGTAGTTIGQAVSDLLNSGPPTDGGFSAAGCTASFVSDTLEILCPLGAPVEIDFDGGGFQPLAGATVNGLEFIPFDEEDIPTLSQAGIIVLLTLLMLAGVFYIQRRKITLER